MTNEQALDILEHNWTKLVNPDCTDEELGQALDIAIKALDFKEEIIRMVNMGVYPEAIVEWVKEQI